MLAGVVRTQLWDAAACKHCIQVSEWFYSHKVFSRSNADHGTYCHSDFPPPAFRWRSHIQRNNKCCRSTVTTQTVPFLRCWGISVRLNHSVRGWDVKESGPLHADHHMLWWSHITRVLHHILHQMTASLKTRTRYNVHTNSQTAEQNSCQQQFLFGIQPWTEK